MDRTACVSCPTIVSMSLMKVGVEAKNGTADATAPRRRAQPVKVRARANDGGTGLLPSSWDSEPGSRRRPPAGDSAARDLAADDLAAGRPDAVPGRWDNFARAAGHAAILLSVVAFILVYCVWAPLRDRIAARASRASVMIVGSSLCEVRAPAAAGIFRAVAPLPHGSRVRKGDLLGRIDSPELDRAIERTSLELRGLESRRLRLDRRSVMEDQWAQQEQEARELAGRVEAVAQSLAHLHAVRSQLSVRAPCGGLVQEGVPATASVAPDQLIVSIYPDGGELLIEVTASFDVVTALQRERRFTASFATPDGNVEIVARPSRAAPRSFRRGVTGDREETWATLQCLPTAVPAALRSPGLIGELRR